MLSNSKMISKEDGILGTIWEGFVGMFKFVLKNQGTNTLATVVPLEGNLNNVQAGIFPTILNIFENAWINAFKGEIDEDIDYQDAIKEADLDNMSSEERREYKRAQRKAKRKERREERKNDTTLP